MTLTAPIALLGLLTLPVIAALHMLRARSEQRPVSSLSLWGFLSPQLRGASSRRLPITPLLIMDLAIAALLSLALSGPHLAVDNLVREDIHQVLLIDVSTSMGAVDTAPSRLARALGDARQLVASGSGGDIFTVITFGAGAATAADSRDPNFSEQLAALNRLVPGEPAANLTAALSLARATTDPEIPAEVHVFSDFADPAPDLAEYSLPLVWHPYGSSTDNQAVIAFNAVRLSESKLQVFARFAHYGAAPVTRGGVLMAAGQVVSEFEIALDPESSQTYAWELIGNYPFLSVEMSGSDDLPLDDSAYTAVSTFAGSPSTALSVAVVAEQPGPLLRALQAYPEIDVQVIAPDDYLPGSPFDLVAFRGDLPARWPGGTVLVVDPPQESDLLGSMRTAPVQGNLFPAVDPLLDSIDWTGVRWDRVWIPASFPTNLASLEPLLTAGNQALLLHGRVGLTELVLLLAETADENGTPSGLARHPAFPVLVANILRLAAGTSFPDRVPAGAALQLPSAARYPSITIESPENAVVVFSGDRPIVWTGLRTPGIAVVTVEDQEGLAETFFIGINAGDLAESDIAPGGWTGGIAAPPRPAAQNEQPLALAPWLLAAAVVLMLVEAWWAWR